MMMRALAGVAGCLADRLQRAADFCADVKTFATTYARWDVIRARRAAIFADPELN